MYSCIFVFLYSCLPLPVFPHSRIYVFLYSCIRVFLYSCIPVFLYDLVHGIPILYSVFPVFSISCILYFLYFWTPRKTAPGSWRAAPVPMLLRLETARPKASGGTPLEQVEWLDAARSGVVTRLEEKAARLISAGHSLSWVLGCADSGGSALHWAAMRDAAGATSWLVAHGAPLDAASPTLSTGAGSALTKREIVSGYSALHAAAHLGHLRPMALLLEAGASVESTDRRHRTPLHYAASNPTANADPIRLLMSYGSPLSTPDAFDVTPIQLARRVLHPFSTQTPIFFFAPHFSPYLTSYSCFLRRVLAEAAGVERQRQASIAVHLIEHAERKVRQMMRSIRTLSPKRYLNQPLPTPPHPTPPHPTPPHTHP